MKLNWFNLAAPWFFIGRTGIRPWTLFNRRSKDGHFWGIGLLQIGSRHLIYVGHSGAGLLFIGQPGHFATWRYQALSVWLRVWDWLKKGTVIDSNTNS